MTLQVLNGPVIQAGESVSDALDCSAGSIVRLTMPGEWTPANITFLISSDGLFFNPLVDFNGNPVTLTVVPGSAVVVSPLSEYLKAVPFLKIQSGTPKHPVRQAEERWFAVAIDPAEPVSAADPEARSRPGKAD